MNDDLMLGLIFHSSDELAPILPADGLHMRDRVGAQILFGLKSSTFSKDVQEAGASFGLSWDDHSIAIFVVDSRSPQPLEFVLRREGW